LGLVAEGPCITLSMLRTALFRVTPSSAMRADLRGTSAYNKVGYVLSELSRSTRELAESPTPQLRITHEEISRVCDLSRQTVTTILGAMQANAIVELGLRSIRVLDRQRLALESEGASLD
ncbi:MAG: helix-turn-helix domain-containing protein, partial [Devosia sp.]